MKKCILFVVSFAVILTGCHKAPDVTNPSSPNFIRVEDRIATFDMDGTFLGELYPTYFEDFVRNKTPLPDNFEMIHAHAAAKAYEGMTLAEQWREAGYHVISMRDDFKTIYGYSVKKEDFHF